MKIGITGCKGFIGQNLVKYLLEHSIDFIDINANNIQSIDYSNIQHIIHLAAKTSVENSWEHVHQYIDSNVAFTSMVLDLAKKLKISITICSSYGSVGITKPSNAPNPYHFTKLLAEELCDFYYKNFSVPIVVLKLANVYGAGQKSTFLIPTIIEQILRKDIKEVVVNSLTPQRSFIDVRDVVDFMLYSIPKRTSYKTYYVGTNIQYSVEEVINKCLQIAGISKPYCQRSIEKINEIKIDFSYISSKVDTTDWMPKYSLEEGLSNLINIKNK